MSQYSIHMHTVYKPEMETKFGHSEFPKRNDMTGNKKLRYTLSKDGEPTDITLDHVTCHADGGSNGADNLITACRSCNCSRQDKPLSRFAGPETRKHIRRNLKRSIAPCRKLAKAIIAGETEDPRGNL